MIYLYTGNPGMGKTCAMMSLLAHDKDFKERTVYIDGIEILDHEAIKSEAMPENCNAANWHEWLPTGSILIVDECQRYWRPRANGSRVPEAIQAMETHRHKGVDIYLITQKPSLIDANIRALVGSHRHFSMTALGMRRVMEWTRTANPEQKSDVAAAMIKPYMLDESVYDYYKSSEQHNKPKVNLSIVRFLLPLFLLLGLSILGYSIYSFFNEDNIFRESEKKAQTKQEKEPTEQNKENKEKATENAIPTTASMTKGVINAFDGKQTQTASEPKLAKQDETETLKESDFEPSIKGQPWTAPAYAHLSGKSQIKSMPFPAGCIKTKTSCNCYTEQSTVIKGIPKSQCIDYAINGIYNPYKTTAETLPEPKNGTYTDTPTPNVAPQVQTMSGGKKNDLMGGGVDLGLQ